jgi:hypothetical protein
MQTTIDSTRTTLILTRTMPLNARKLSGWSLGGTPGGDRISLWYNFSFSRREKSTEDCGNICTGRSDLVHEALRLRKSARQRNSFKSLSPMETMRLGEKQLIRHATTDWQEIAYLALKSKNFYNRANYEIRPHFFHTNRILDYKEMGSGMQSEKLIASYPERCLNKFCGI